MKYLIVKVYWDKCRDPRVKELSVKMFFLGQDKPIDSYSLPPGTNFLTAVLKDNTTYHINITSVIDDKMYSESSITFDIPDMTNPLPLTGLNWEIMQVLDIDTEDILEKVREGELKNELDELDELDAEIESDEDFYDDMNMESDK